jgi:hypothetical protein
MISVDSCVNNKLQKGEDGKKKPVRRETMAIETTCINRGMASGQILGSL